MTRTITFIFLLATSFQLIAETVYVRDIIYVPLRGGQSQEHRILHQGLRSGLKLERIETNQLTGYSRVRTEDGLEGWLESQYLVTEPIAVEKLDGVTSKLQELEAQHQQALLKLREAKEAKEATSAKITRLDEEKQELVKELAKFNAMASDTISTNQKNSMLNDKKQELVNRVNELTLANKTLRDDDSQKWFLRGSATILLGLVFGLWIGRRIYQQRNRGGWG